MIIDLSEYQFYLKPGITDMRKAINGLTLLIQNQMNHSPFFKKSVSVLQQSKKKSENHLLGQ